MRDASLGYTHGVGDSFGIIAGTDDGLAGCAGRSGPRAEVIGPTAECSANRPPLSGAVRSEPPQCFHARVDVIVRVVVLAFVEPQPADDAQPGAVRPAQRRDRLCQLDRLTDRRLEVELVMV